MMLHVLAFRNKMLGCHTTPHFTDVNLENCSIGLARSLKSGTPEQRVKYKGLDLYHIADFNDESGEIIPCTPVLLLNCDDVIAQVETNA